MQCVAQPRRTSVRFKRKSVMSFVCDSEKREMKARGDMKKKKKEKTKKKNEEKRIKETIFLKNGKTEKMIK